MKKQKTQERNKGITLIALVITIIVMLILVAVTISMAVNGGLFDYAGKAVGDTQDAIDAEQVLSNGKIQVDGKWYASINDYLNNTPLVTGLEVTPTEITLKKKESADVDGEEVLTGTITASVFGMDSVPTITWETSSNAVTLSSTTGKTVTVTAAGTENTEVTVTAKCTYEGKEYTATSKITLKIIKAPGITASTMQSNLKSYLGQTVDYGATYTDISSDGGGKWQIFYADEDHIYIITKGFLERDGLSTTGYRGTIDFTEEIDNYPAVAAGLFNKTYDPTASGTEADPYLKYSSDNANMKGTQYLLDSTEWTTYVNELADWAIGSPTLELFVKSYNVYYNKGVTLETPTGYGYSVTTSLSWYESVPEETYLLPTSTSPSTTNWYDWPANFWLACPSSIGAENFLSVMGGTLNGISNGTYYGGGYYNTSGPLHFRPVVCLDSNVNMTWDDTNSQYNLYLISED